MASPKVRWGEAKKLEDMRKSTEQTWQDFTEMRTGFVSPLTLSVTATSLESYQWMNLQKGLPRTALSFHFKELRACKVREWRESRHTAWEADTHAQPGWWEYEFGSSAPVHRQTDLPWDFSGCSLQGIPFLLVARNHQQLKSPGSPVAASWSYRSIFFFPCLAQEIPRYLEERKSGECITMKSLFYENPSERRETGRHSLEHRTEQKRIKFRIAFSHWKTFGVTDAFRCLEAQFHFLNFLCSPIFLVLMQYRGNRVSVVNWLPEWPWTSYLISLRLNSFIY